MKSSGITLNQVKKQFAPFERIEGRVTWNLDQVPKHLEIRLFWFTDGKGNEEFGVIDILRLQTIQQGEAEFSFDLPEGPYSFSGNLITLIWGLELVANPGGSLSLETFVLSPMRQELRLGTALNPVSGPPMT